MVENNNIIEINNAINRLKLFLVDIEAAITDEKDAQSTYSKLLNKSKNLKDIDYLFNNIATDINTIKNQEYSHELKYTAIKNHILNDIKKLENDRSM